LTSGTSLGSSIAGTHCSGACCASCGDTDRFFDGFGEVGGFSDGSGDNGRLLDGSGDDGRFLVGSGSFV
jgi:hypothetical protein